MVPDDPDLAATLIVAGASLGRMLQAKALPPVEAGRLVHVPGEWCVPFEGLRLDDPSRPVTPALRTLIDGLRWTS